MPPTPAETGAALLPAESGYRLRNERQFIDGEGLRSPKARTPLAPRGAPVLLDDDQVAHFLANGYLPLQPSLPASFHAEVFETFLGLAGRDSDNDTGNNILPVVPAVYRLFEDPVVKGALDSVLGPDNYFLHPHRALHSNPPGSPPQVFHHDTYWGYKRKVHNHHPWWVMIMYYPQDIYPAIGPTGVVPGTHMIAQRLDDIAQIEIPAEGPGGTCMMIHFDLWHRKMQNLTDLDRYMLKCQFVRLRPPAAPTWNTRRRYWTSPATLPAYGMEPAWREHWDWLSGGTAERPAAAAPADAETLRGALADADAAARREAIAAIGRLGEGGLPFIADLAARLDDPSEPVGLSAAYALGALGRPAIAPLVAAMRANDGDNVDDARVFVDEGQKSELEMQARNATHGLVAVGADAAPALVEAFAGSGPRMRKYIAFALGEIRDDSAPVHDVLLQAAADPDENVRMNAVEALGLKAGTPRTVAALVAALADDADEVRFNAALALARLGPAAEPATEALVAALDDGNRYVIGYAVEALERIGSPRATHALLTHLKGARWCPLTSNKSLF
ncbi:MAG: HEAT repeat domain-containing protein [Alphaproteobacteria bacterium]